MLTTAIMACLLSACATQTSSGEADEPIAHDPFERWNRGIYKFNDGIDRLALKPVARAYGQVVPEPVRNGVHNFIGNVGDAWSVVNLVLQGRIEHALNDGMRVSVNTFLGMAGFLDVASEMRLDGHKQDFGLTLGHWGVSSGPYIVWPILGPSTVRDSFNIPLEFAVGPAAVINGSTAVSNSITTISVIDKRHSLLPVTDVLEEVAIDPYSFVRDGYFQRRNNLIEDGLSSRPETDAATRHADAARPADASATAAAPTIACRFFAAAPMPVSTPRGPSLDAAQRSGDADKIIHAQPCFAANSTIQARLVAP